MNDPLKEAVNTLLGRIAGSGCDDGVVSLAPDPSCHRCQFERGACLRATFGGHSAEFSTFDPLTATTRISFMAGADLRGPARRSAAAAIVNATAGFFCISRRHRACDPSCHAACMAELLVFLRGRRFSWVGEAECHDQVLRRLAVADPQHAAVLIVTGDGLTRDDIGEIISRDGPGREVLWIGPSTSAVAALLSHPHWCPHGVS